MAAKQYDLVIKLVSNQRSCPSGHKVGDEWLWQDQTPSGLCWAAYNAIFPFAIVLKYGGTFPWQQDPDVITASCPDHEVVNVFEIRRTPRKPRTTSQTTVPSSRPRRRKPAA
jgi:uncharacterized repeat protein (TIGR04076 family)